MANLKTIKLHSHATGPNPWKVAGILEELGVPYEHEFIDMSKIKEEPYISININGRVPAIEDPNTGITLWESGAIIQYLITTYDTTHKISYPTSSPQTHLTNQWLHLQTSTQGPYYGQFFHFNYFHPVKIPTAIERYKNEVMRVVGVINAHLERTGQMYLVGERCTYADLAFVPWGLSLHAGKGGRYGFDPYEGGRNEAYRLWFERLINREAIRKVIQEKERAAVA